MPRRWLPVLLALAAVAGAVAWALSGLPGSSAVCLPAGCDCETAVSHTIRQPANAWSSLTIAAAGVTFLASRQGQSLTGLTAGGALVAAGTLAFLAHAGLTAWAARLDGIGVAVLVGALALWRWWGQSLPPPWRRGRAHRAGPTSRFFPPPDPLPPTAAGRGDQTRFALPAAPSRQARRGRATLFSWLLLATGGLFWLLGRTGGPWCQPTSPLQAHAAWHLLAAVAIALWLHAGRPKERLPSRISPLPLASGREEQDAL